jgi:hypothetical protein
MTIVEAFFFCRIWIGSLLCGRCVVAYRHDQGWLALCAVLRYNPGECDLYSLMAHSPALLTFRVLRTLAV